jgi:hypothetical protein
MIHNPSRGFFMVFITRHNFKAFFPSPQFRALTSCIISIKQHFPGIFMVFIRFEDTFEFLFRT